MSAKLVYLDHNATTPLRPESRAAMLAALEVAGNPSSIHRVGVAARKIVDAARADVAALVGADPRAAVVFTSGATEANTLVLKGTGAARILTSALEHPSVLEAVPGAETIPARRDGMVDMTALENMLRDDDRPALVSVMMVNNETGVIQPVAEVARIARRHGALVHTDATQAAGRIPLDLKTLGVDFLTLSSHKIGGPPGAGALVMASCVPLTPLLRGGGQEKGLRAGTENVPALAGFGAAARAALTGLADGRRLAALRDDMERRLRALAPGLRVFDAAPRVANTSLFALPGAPSDMQMIALDLAGVCVSNGSACASGTVKSSHVLTAMGVDGAEAACALRVSLGWTSTAEDIECFLRAWGEMHSRLASKPGAA